MSVFTWTNPTSGQRHDAIFAGGAVRLLAVLPDPKVFRAPGFPFPVIPRSEWPRRAFRNRVQDVPIKDQGTHGSCVNHGFASALEITRAYMGQTYYELSGTYAYCSIKLGYDGGSIPSDMAKWLVEKGLCLATECPSTNIDPSRVQRSAPGTAMRFRVPDDSLFECVGWDQIVTAVLMGFAIAGTVRVVGGWDNLSPPFVPPWGRGPGNHVTCMGEGVLDLGGGRVGIDCRNSWSPQWGDRGYYTLTEDHVRYQTDASFYAFRTATIDPKDPQFAAWGGL